MRIGTIIMLWLLVWGVAITIGNTSVRAQERVVPTSAIVPPTYTATAVVSTATNTAVAATSTTVPSGSTSGTQTAVAMVTQTALANQNLTATATATPTAAASSTAVVATATIKPTQTQPNRLPNTGIIDGRAVWQNQPLVVVMVVTGVLGLAFLFYGQRN